MKRLFCFLMILVLCLTSLPVATAEESEFIYKDEQLEDLYYEFKDVSSTVETVFGNPRNLTYWDLADVLENGNLVARGFQFAWNAGATIAGEARDKQFYTQVLVSLITLMDYELAFQIENQSQFDNLKGIDEYIYDAADIAATAVGMSEQCRTLTATISLLNNDAQLLIETIDEVKYYEQIIRSYAESDSFLQAILDYSNVKALRDAAQELITVNGYLMEERFNFICSTAGNIATFTAKSFMETLNLCYLGTVLKFDAVEIVQDCVKYCEIITETLMPHLATIYKTGMIFGDVVFGTTDVFRRYNEMVASAEIAQCLVKAYEEIDVSLNSPSKTLYGNMKAKCGLYKNLLSVHARGEYLIYSIRYNDSGIISEIKKQCELRDKPVTQEWYDDQTNTITQQYQRVNELFLKLNSVQFVVQEGCELHDGFIVDVQQQDTVPEGYIGVYTYEDFKKISDSCPSDAGIKSSNDYKNEFTNGKFILMNDITLPDDYDPAGVFYGVLDGNGYTIHNLQNSLFVFIWGATVKNLGIEVNYSAQISREEDDEVRWGAIAPLAMGDSPFIEGEKAEHNYVDNCFVKGHVDITCFYGKVGGLIGLTNSTAITNCYNDADITLSTASGGYLGGICGRKEGEKTENSFFNCFNAGNLDFYSSGEHVWEPDDAWIYVGGIQGSISMEDVVNCYNSGNISAITEKACKVYCGGITGEYSSSGEIKNCYNLADVTNNCLADYDVNGTYGGAFSADYCTGGIVGELDGSRTGQYISKCWNSGKISGEHFAGGICGTSSAKLVDAISNCYNIGSVSAVQYAGGLVGMDNGYTCLTNCYNTGHISGMWCGSLAATLTEGDDEHLTGCYILDDDTPAVSDGLDYNGVTKLTLEELKDPESFEAFDFSETWKLRKDDDSPSLRYE